METQKRIEVKKIKKINFFKSIFKIKRQIGINSLSLIER
jgi:hypothetical protein